MKVFLVSIVVLFILGAGGVFFLSMQSKSPGESTGTVFKTEAVVKVGTIQPGNGDDYNHLLFSEGKTIGITSYTIKLDQFVGKKVEVK